MLDILLMFHKFLRLLLIFFPTLLDLIFRLGELCFNNWLFVHLPTVGHLGRLQFLVILRKAAVNIFMQDFMWTRRRAEHCGRGGTGMRVCLQAAWLVKHTSETRASLLKMVPSVHGSSGFLSLSLKSNNYKVKVGHSPCLRPFPGPSLP